MNCIKCGQKLRDNRVFCDACLQEAEAHPVDPATPIMLPRHTAEPAAKKRTPRKRPALSAEEQLPRLRSANRILLVALVLSLLAFALSAWVCVSLLESRDRPSASVVSRETITQAIV